MARGRRPDTAEVKRAKGNPGRRRIVETPASLPVLAETPHVALSMPARKVWAQIAPELARLRFLRLTDRDAFARYCEHLAKWWELTRALRKEGETYFSKSEHNPEGLYRVNPKFLIRERVEKRLEVLEANFGLTPAARQQILHRLSVLPTGAAGDLFKPAEDQPDGQIPAPTEDDPIGLLARAAQVH